MTADPQSGGTPFQAAESSAANLAYSLLPADLQTDMNQAQPYSPYIYNANTIQTAHLPMPPHQPTFPPHPTPPAHMHLPQPQGNISTHPRFHPNKKCFICGDPAHLANRCPHRRQTNTPSTPTFPPTTPTDRETRVVVDMDTMSEANEVREYVSNVKKRKRPVQVSDFKQLAVEIVKELRNQSTRPPVEPPCRATSSPNKSTTNPTPSSNGKSICSKAANKHLTAVFKESFESLGNQELKSMLDNANIEWNDYDFRTTARKTGLIAKLAAAKSQEQIDKMKGTSGR